MRMRIYAVLIAWCGWVTCGLAAPAPLPLTVNSQAPTAPGLTVYRASETVIRARFFDGTNATALGAQVPYIAWATNSTASSVVTGSWAAVVGTTGVVDFTWSASDLNYAPGRYHYEVGILQSSGAPTTVRHGALTIIGSPFAAGADPVTWTTNWNLGLVTLTGVIPEVNLPVAAILTNLTAGSGITQSAGDERYLLNSGSLTSFVAGVSASLVATSATNAGTIAQFTAANTYAVNASNLAAEAYALALAGGGTGSVYLAGAGIDISGQTVSVSNAVIEGALATPDLEDVLTAGSFVDGNIAVGASDGMVLRVQDDQGTITLAITNDTTLILRTDELELREGHYTGDGSGLTNLDADNMAYGTVPLARLNALRYLAYTDANATVYLSSIGPTCSVSLASTTLTLSNPGGARVLGASVAWRGDNLGASMTWIHGTADAPNAAIASRWPPLVQVYRSDTGAYVATSQAALDTSNMDRWTVGSIPTTAGVTSHVVMGW